MPSDPGGEHELAMMYLREGVEPKRLDRRAWVMIALAFVPLIVLAVLAFAFGR